MSAFEPCAAVAFETLGPPRTNDRPMDAPQQPATEPPVPAAEPLPAGALCSGCTYDLVGRAPGERCPECGLDVAASWPVWDLRACHRGYVEHVAEEFRMLHWAALTAWVVLAATLAASLAGAMEGRVGGIVAVAIGVGMVAMGAVVVLPLVVWYAQRSLRAHPNARAAPGAAERRRLRWALRFGEAGLLGVLLWVPVAAFGGGDDLAPLLFAGAAVATVGLAWASFEAMRYANHTIGRAGKAATSGGFIVAWGFTLAALGLALAATLAFALDQALRGAAIAGGLLAPATVVALRCGRVVAVADAIAARRA